MLADVPANAWSPSLRQWWSAGVRLPSETHFALIVSLIWTALYNFAFWDRTVEAMWRPTLGGVGFLVSLAVLVVGLQSLLLLSMPNRATMRAAASVLFVVAAAGAYFCNEYGTIMNKDMLRNALETDAAEVAGLINPDMLASIVVLGVLPGMLVWRISLPEVCWSQRLRQRLKAGGAILAVCVVALFSCSANYAMFFREHKPIRFALLPAAPMVSLIGVLGSEGQTDPGTRLANPAGESHRTGPVRARPLVLFVVIGETARAANFQLGGYPRETNPELMRLDRLVYFDRTLSCGTSTALSVPCMFSALPRQQFRLRDARAQANLLDALTQAGVDVEWRDNNAGCKGVCDRVARISYEGSDDEVMLADLRLGQIERDTVIVFHQMGSHGPRYTDRYPPRFERFRPACRSNRLPECTAQEIVNAYDNTIVYTDHVLARQIGILEAASDRIDAALIYVSDHGESLGEQGIYLHGMPYAFAPEVQKRVPMLLWTSAQYDERIGLRPGCVRARAHEDVSHDNLYHTILGLTEVRNRAYEPALDILSGCRGASGFDHE